jgi:hypothetical protein
MLSILPRKVSGGACCRYCQGEPGGPVYPWQQLQGMMIVRSVRLVIVGIYRSREWSSSHSNFLLFLVLVQSTTKQFLNHVIISNTKPNAEPLAGDTSFTTAKRTPATTTNATTPRPYYLYGKQFIGEIAQGKQRVHDVCHK